MSKTHETEGGAPLALASRFEGVDHPLRMRDWQSGAPSSVVYYELDLSGNVRRLRAPGGGDLGGYRYEAFGKMLPADAATPAPVVEQPLRWKGRPWSAFGGPSGTYDMRARVWSPDTGRFLSIDGLGYHDGRGTLFSWPNQNPLRFSDPSGHRGVYPVPTVDPVSGLLINANILIWGLAFDQFMALGREWDSDAFWHRGRFSQDPRLCTASSGMGGGGGGRPPLPPSLGIGGEDDAGAPMRGIGGSGWRGDQQWRKAVREVGRGGTIRNINGKVPTKSEAIDLIRESGGLDKNMRVDPPHEAPNPHINYTTPDGLKGTIEILP